MFCFLLELITVNNILNTKHSVIVYLCHFLKMFTVWEVKSNNNCHFYWMYGKSSQIITVTVTECMGSQVK